MINLINYIILYMVRSLLMKKYLGIYCLFMVLLARNLSSQQINLDQTITRAARGVEEVLPQGTMVAILNFVSPSETFSDHVIEELTGKLVTGRKITIVDRRSLALIREEMSLQLSGDVSDESAQAIGRMLGAQSIVSGNLTNMGTFYRFRVRVINVETAAIQTQVSLDLQNDSQVAFLLGSTSANVQVTVPEAFAPSINSINVPGNALAEKLAWLQRSADSHNTYIIEVNRNETIDPHVLEYRGTINITIILRGVGGNRIIRLRSPGFMIRITSNVNLIIDNNITIQGHNQNAYDLIYVNGGKLILNSGASISGNGANRGVWINNNGTFEMNGGTISGNTAGGGGNGGGIHIGSDGIGHFIMNGGTISNNNAIQGGGVEVMEGTFTMNGGIISNNISTEGGGVSVRSGGTFHMRGGTITGNTSRDFGGGVFLHGGTFIKTGGNITGYGNDPNNGNVVRDRAGNILSRRGHAVFVNENLRKETTAGTGVNLSDRDTGRWD